MRVRSRWRSFATSCLKGLLACVVFFGALELTARFGFGFRPLTPGTFLFQHDARRGWSHRPNSEGLFVKLGFQTPIHINSRGLREREIPYEKPPGTVRVLVIGDSNVAGFEVGEDETFARVTESVLRQRGYAVEFVNAGHRGYGTDQSLLLLMDEGLKYDPDLVLYFWSDNDVDDNSTVHRPFRPYGKGYFDLDEQGALVLRGVPVPRFRYETGSRVGEDGKLREVEVPPLLRASVMARDEIISRSAFATFLVWAVARLPHAERTLLDAGSFGDFREQGGVPPPDTQSRSFRLTLALIREMERVAIESGARFQMIGVGGAWSETLRREAGITELRDWGRYVEHIPDGADVKTPFDAHWNALGNRLYAEQLADLLVQYELIPRPLDVAGRDSAGKASVASP